MVPRFQGKTWNLKTKLLGTYPVPGSKIYRIYSRFQKLDNLFQRVNFKLKVGKT